MPPHQQRDIHASHKNYHPTPSWVFLPREDSSTTTVPNDDNNNESAKTALKLRIESFATTYLSTHSHFHSHSYRRHTHSHRRHTHSHHRQRQHRQRQQPKDFEHSTDERSMAAAKQAKRDADVDSGLARRVREFMVRYLLDGRDVGEGAVGVVKRKRGADGPTDEAPVLRPRRGRRWSMNNA